MNARAHSPAKAKEQEIVHGIGTARQHAKQHAQKDETRTKPDKTLTLAAGRLDTISIMAGGLLESLSDDLSITGHRLFARPEIEAECG